MSKSGIILVIVGCIALAHNFDLLQWGWLRQWWPLGLIALGVWTIVDHRSRGDKRS